jgi:hypothetical protein
MWARQVVAIDVAALEVAGADLPVAASGAAAGVAQRDLVEGVPPAIFPADEKAALLGAQAHNPQGRSVSLKLRSGPFGTVPIIQPGEAIAKFRLAPSCNEN